jgi:hypothetical protein
MKRKILAWNQTSVVHPVLLLSNNWEWGRKERERIGKKTSPFDHM